MLKLFILFISLMFSSCSVYGPKSRVSVFDSDIEQVYIELIRSEMQDENGFIDYKHCDSLLHTGLLGVHKKIKVNITAAELSPGQWLRRPINYDECYKSGESRSTISRDMLLGLIWYSVYNDRLDILENLWDYGVNHFWIMGEDDTGGFHTIMNSKMISLLARSIKYLGGNYSKFWVNTPIKFSDNCGGYVCHLTALQIGLLAKINGGVSESEFKVLKQLKNRNPNNILYQTLYHKYLDGDYTKVYNLIDSKYPPNRLPNNLDWGDDWPVQRDDDDPGLRPSRETRQHSGGELLFVLALINN